MAYRRFLRDSETFYNFRYREGKQLQLFRYAKYFFRNTWALTLKWVDECELPNPREITRHNLGLARKLMKDVIKGVTFNSVYIEVDGAGNQ